MKKLTITLITGNIRTHNLDWEKDHPIRQPFLGVHPIEQVKKTEAWFRNLDGDKTIFTHSPYVAEAIIVFAKHYGHNVKCYLYEDGVKKDVTDDKGKIFADMNRAFSLIDKFKVEDFND